MSVKPYDKEETFQNLESIKSDLYNFSAELNSANMELVRKAIVQACIEEAIANLNTAVHALEPIEITFA